MLFSDGTRGSKAFSLIEATASAYPRGGGVYAPEGEPDLRELVLGPELSFSETAARAVSILFPEIFDGDSARAVAMEAFPDAPPLTSIGADLLGFDLSTGPTGNASDYTNRFIASISSRVAPGSHICLAAMGGRELRSLASALLPYGSGLVALCPEEGLAGIPQGMLEREGGSVRLVGLRGGTSAAWDLERMVAAGRGAGLDILPLGIGTPARLAGRSILSIALFMAARRGMVGDLYIAVPQEDPSAIAAALWAWSWGLPFTGLIVPDWKLPEGELPDEYSERAESEILGRFKTGHPISSLVHRVPIGREDLFETLADPSRWCDHGDEHSIAAFAASHRALEGGLGGHARIVVPRFSRPADPETALPKAPDIVIDADPASLARVLAAHPSRFPLPPRIRA